MEKQMSIFDGANEFRIDKPVRLIELFAGYGSQHLALKYLGKQCESYKICEWAVKSIQAYKDLHFGNNNTDYSKGLTQSEVVDFLFNKHISMDYNQSMTFEQIKRLGESKQRQIYNNIIATHNMVDISNTKASDLNIVNTDIYVYILTYSFPCQDLSLAGKRMGMSADSGTRSSLLWQVDRILHECEELPQVLIMENVPEVHGTKNIKSFAKWVERLEKLGYKNYWQDLLATDYGIPQTRNRTFMVSLLGDYDFNFPDKIPLNLKLENLLEKQVDEKFYIKKYHKILSKFIKKIDTTKIKNWTYIDCFKNIIRYDNLSGTLTTRTNASSETFLIKNNNGKLDIRKYLPIECFRIMGVKDTDFEKIAKNQYNASLYHLAGDSIVTTCLMAIFSQLYGIDYKKYLDFNNWREKE